MMFTENQRATLALWYCVNTSLVSYYKLIEAFHTPVHALLAGAFAWQKLGINKNHIKRLEDTASVDAFLHGVHEQVEKNIFGLMVLGDDDYPQALNELYDPPPVLFYKGNKERLSCGQLAVVGTRNPSEYAQTITFEMAKYWAAADFVITSGLALGVDSCAHRGALIQATGMTVGVMGTGIDTCYPRQNQGLCYDIVQQGGCLVTELLPGTPASKHTFPRRNRLIVGLSVATIIMEAAIKSGSMISARLAAEQGKQVFAVPGRIDGVNSEGCHHLIREGATLIYHPIQVIEELNQTYIKPIKPTASTFFDENHDSVLDKTQSHSSADLCEAKVPEHLRVVYGVLDALGQDLDKLVLTTGLPAGELLGKLTELEILGFVRQLGGRYVKV